MKTLSLDVTNAAYSLYAKGYDPGVKPKFDAPWMGVFKTLGGQIAGTVIVLLFIVVVIGALVWAASKFAGVGPGQEKGLQILGISAIAAVVIGSAGGAIAWFSGLSLF